VGSPIGCHPRRFRRAASLEGAAGQFKLPRGSQKEGAQGELLNYLSEIRSIRIKEMIHGSYDMKQVLAKFVEPFPRKCFKDGDKSMMTVGFEMINWPNSPICISWDI
jgi:hypothetical protein